MPITYEIDETLKIIRETWSGEVSEADLGAHWRRYLEDARVLALRRTLVDLRDSKPLFTGSEMRNLIATVVDPVLAGRDWRTAIIVGEPVHFGVSRQYGVFAEHYSRDAIFSDAKSAEHWLLT